MYNCDRSTTSRLAVALLSTQLKRIQDHCQSPSRSAFHAMLISITGISADPPDFLGHSCFIHPRTFLFTLRVVLTDSRIACGVDPLDGMSTLKRIFSRHAKSSTEVDKSHADLELGHPKSTSNLHGRLSRWSPRTPDPRTPSLSHETPATVETQQSMPPRQTPESSHSRTFRITGYQLPSTMYQTPSRIPRSANIDTPRATHRSQRSTWTQDSEVTHPASSVVPERYQVALQAMQSVSTKSSTPPRDQGRSNSERRFTTSEYPETLSDNIFEDSIAYEPQGNHGQDIADYHATHGFDTFVPNPSSADLGQFAWTPTHSDDESEDPPSLIHRRGDQRSDNASTGSYSPSTPGTGTHLEHPPSIHAGVTELSSSGPSFSSEYLSRDESSVPYLNIDIPAGDLNLRTSCSLPSSSLLRRSQPPTNTSSSQRAMSDAEFARNAKSLGDIAQLKPSLPYNVRRMQAPFVGTMGIQQEIYSQARLPRINTLASAASGPGSSQTSSSLSTDPPNAVQRSRGRVESYNLSSSSSRMRSPTPPILYGRSKMKVEDPEVAPRPMLGRANSRLARAMKANGVGDKSRLAQVYPLGSMDKDWVTVSDMKEAEIQSGGDIDSTKMTGSSLADNSDSGNLSTTKHLQSTIGSINARKLAQQSALPRLHQAFVLMEDKETGRQISVPQHGVSTEAHVTGNGFLHRVEDNTYRHPKPLPEGHLNPFTSSPPAMKPSRNSTEASIDDQIEAIEKPETESPVADRTALTDEFDQLVHRYGSCGAGGETFTSETSSSGLPDQSRSVLTNLDVQDTTKASATTHIVGHVEEDSTPEAQDRKGSFAKVTILGSKGNVTGTPEGTGAREVGSSLAGLSSPLQFSSPPYQASIDYAQTNPPSPSPSEQIRTFESPWRSPSVTFQVRPRNLDSSPRNRRRRSSSESNYKINALPTAASTSARESPGALGHRKANSMAGLLSKGVQSPLIEEPPVNPQVPPKVKDRKSHHSLFPNDLLSSSSQCASTILRHVKGTLTSSPFNHNIPATVLRPDGLIEEHPKRVIIGHGSWASRVPHDEPGSAALLYYLLEPKILDLQRRQKRISTFWLTVIGVLPPAAIGIGHGYFDELIHWHTNGEIYGFSEKSKVAALYWGYGVSSVSVIILIVVLIKLFAA